MLAKPKVRHGHLAYFEGIHGAEQNEQHVVSQANDNGDVGAPAAQNHRPSVRIIVVGSWRLH